MSTVVALRTLRQDELAVEVCPVCEGKNGKHNAVRVSYPWPFNLSVFKYVPCPVEKSSE